MPKVPCLSCPFDFLIERGRLVCERGEDCPTWGYIQSGLTPATERTWPAMREQLWQLGMLPENVSGIEWDR